VSNKSGSAPTIVGREDTDHDGLRLELKSVTDEEVIFSERSTDPALLGVGKLLQLTSKSLCADFCRRVDPVACYQATLLCLPDKKSFRLELALLWIDSLEVQGLSKFRDDQLEVYTRYVIREPQDDFKEDASHIFRRFWQEKELNQQAERWSARDFYKNVHVPENTPKASADIKCGMVESQLYPFQRRAVRWLLQREGMELHSNGKVVQVQKASGNHLPASFQEFADADGQPYFASRLFMNATTGFPDWYDAEENLRGGILAEEMGLGKTVEMIALMCLNRRKLTAEQSPSDVEGKNLKPSGATLIITPPAILEQWKQEIRQHAPALRFLEYTGIQRHEDQSDNALAEMLASYDVVLTTYNTLSREIHYTGGAPDRILRHQKRFEPRKTPLLRIHWWRVCLDEAQMVEHGVSNAAKVARLIPRHNAWAVTGTPIRKDMGDLYGLLLFLHYEPFCDQTATWNRLCGRFHSVLADIVSTITLRHSKDHIRSELDLPPQKRFVITIPFSAVEEQHYGQLFEQMCEDCGLDLSGTPLNNNWDSEDPATVEKMRSWLTRLRQTCLHPEIAGRNRRALGTGNGPLRTVGEVLEVMIDQNDMAIRAEQRCMLLSKIRRGQLLENAGRRQEALDLWTGALELASALVKDCRAQLNSELAGSRSLGGINFKANASPANGESESEDDQVEKNSRIGIYRQRLRAALEVEHICIFFTANAYYQIKSDPKLTAPDSDDFKSLEKQETEAYEAAKSIRKEMLSEVSQRVERYMRSIKDKKKGEEFVHISKLEPHIFSTGIESRRVLEKLEDFCDAINEHSEQYKEWRNVMVNLLLQSLIDQEEDTELEGNEYETSTKHQDEMYVYMEALRAMFADRHDALTGQKNSLVAHEVKGGIIQAQGGEGPSPQLFLSIMNKRSLVKPDPELGSLRGILGELRSLVTSLEWQENEGSARAVAELQLVKAVLENASKMNAEQTKVNSALEKEVEMFRDTMNNRLEYYRQLQQISDTVAPYDEESVGKPMNDTLFAEKLRQEEAIDEKISSLKAKRRYLLHIKEEPDSDGSSRICIICQTDFEHGVLTVCGHKYCKDCLQLWWKQHRTCPICKKRLKARDFHQITYRPEDFVVREEKTTTKMGPAPERSSKNSSIYTDISTGTLKEIKNIDVNGYFGTKIDTLARHILWLRMHDPGSKSIVFSQYRGFLDVLSVALSHYKIGYSNVDSKGGIEKFKNEPAVCFPALSVFLTCFMLIPLQIECFLLHAKAHSSGLNLVNATHVFLCEPLINTAIELQAIARVHRIGQHRATTVWMYLVSGTVEEAIYDLSVSRRLSHITAKKKEEETLASSMAHLNGNDKEGIDETTIDSANSMELQNTALSKIIAGGASGGEIVKKDDLWQCLFGNLSKNKGSGHHSMGADSEVGKFLRAEAAKQRAAKK